MDEYGAVVAGLADTHGTLLIDTQRAFDEILKRVHPCAICADGFIPVSWGLL